MSAIPVLSVSATEDRSCNVLKDSGGFFDHVQETGPRLTSRFFADLKKGATAEEIRSHLTNESILAHFLATKLTSVEKSCRFDSSVDSTYAMYLNWVGIDLSAVNECFLSHCAQLLSGVLKSGPPAEREFHDAVDSIVSATERSDTDQSAFLSLGLRRASLEAYRQLYADGTPEKIVVSLDEVDFKKSSYDDFLSWYKGLLNQPTSASGAPDGNAAVSPQQHICKARVGPMIRQLNIDRRGWGQRTILLIDQGYSSNGAEGIANATLRDLCPPHAPTEQRALNILPDRLASSISCAREQLGDDRWLVVYSNKQPVANLQEMKTLAESIATALGGEICSDTRARIYIANFTRQD